MSPPPPNQDGTSVKHGATCDEKSGFIKILPRRSGSLTEADSDGSGQQHLVPVHYDLLQLESNLYRISAGCSPYMLLGCNRSRGLSGKFWMVHTLDSA